MKLSNRLTRILCGAGLAVALTAVPGTWALTQSSAGMKAGAMSAMQSGASKIDINTATADQLKAVPGIGDTYAKKIIAGRPYTTKHQLVSKGILPNGVYEKVKGQLIANRGKK